MRGQHGKHGQNNMKRSIFLVSILVLTLLSSCKKDVTEINKKAIVETLFNAGMAWNSQDSTKHKALKATYPINYSVDERIESSNGGSIHVFGTVTGNISLDDQTGETTGGLLLLGLTETINDFQYESEGETYTMSGDPYVSLTGTFSLLSGGNSFGGASSMQIGGGIHISGPRVDQTINIRITIIVNASGTGGTVSGSINDESIYFTF